MSFALPATHRLVMGEGHPSDDAANFFIALFGMLKGLRLQRDTWQHFYRCPLQPRSLCDFLATDREIIEALNLGAEFWMALPDDAARRLAFGAIHWHLFAQLYDHEFERFNAQYMALDTCWKLATRLHPRLAKGKLSHAKRVQELGKELQIPLPEWALVSDELHASTLSTRRNELIHEALYGDQPVGFAYPDDGRVERELTCFVARLVLRLLGVENEYTGSSSTTRQRFGFSFPAQGLQSLQPECHKG